MQEFKPRVLISACLCGIACRYDGESSRVEELALLQAQGKALAVCPEVDGGLPVPRPPCELLDGRAKSRDGQDLTAYFLAGAEQALKLAARQGIQIAILKDKSPSCGSSRIYDGTFEGRLIGGEGLTTALLRRHGIEVFSELNYQAIRNAIFQTSD